MKANTTLLLSLSVLATSSCALFQGPTYDNKKLEGYVQGTGFSRSDLADIENNLTRKAKMAGDIYRVKLYPYTEPLIEALVDDQAAAFSLTKEQRKTLKTNLEERYLKRKTCFQFHYQVTRQKEASQLTDWKVQVIDSHENIYDTSWAPESIAAIPAKSFDYIGSVREPMWIGEGVACTNQKVDLSKDFDAKLTVAFAPFPFDKEETLSWQYPVYKEVDGEKVEVEEKSKNYKGYRAW